jgi:hypothetical protein
VKFILLMLAPLMLSGCFTTTLVAPENMPVRIMAEGEKATYHEEVKDWYIFAGLLPIYRHDLADMIREAKLVEVRVRTEDRISDGLITFATDFLGFILPIFPQTIVVEGNISTQSPLTHGTPAPSRPR